ncbi:lysosomal alpha-mannosidase-like [Cylas formicarius]|uniref:lysosomal alpha-mannosidase-like n=1 Tax=Cylas formicarius TaxID=197179 RepID=UPI00295864B4|nr:lysosomal alpha-mannosidase-like [Cylas formicarius]
MFTKIILYVFLVFRLLNQCSGSASAVSENCKYQSCPPIKAGYVNVHLVPHSHLDVGWMKTLDQYYFGTSNYVSSSGAQYIFDTVMTSLKRKTERKFMFVETAFFWKWWNEQEEAVQNQFKSLVIDGQIQFVGGGWTMNDEAVTNYQSIIDQITWGLRRLNDTFGQCGIQRIAWQIDTYGHSSEMASILAGIGYDAVFLGRIDFQDRVKRLKEKSMELIWRGSPSLGADSEIFTHILLDHYTAPPGFCFDISCKDEPIIDNPKSAEYNIVSRAINFTTYVDNALQSSTSNNVFLPMGGDFAYQDAQVWYKSMDKLIKYLNKNEVNGRWYNLFYSSPYCYLNALHSAVNGTLTTHTKQDDFFPYAKEDDLYWTGLYTSKPTLKRFERIGNNFLQVCKQLSALTGVSGEGSENLRKLNTFREAMGVMQHHDAITGTERSYVAQDYARQLHGGIANCEQITNDALTTLTKNADVVFKTCLLSNISQCLYSENMEQLIVTIYNPLSRPVDKYVRLPISDEVFVVKDWSGIEMITQVLPIPKRVQNIPGRQSSATREQVFLARDVPALGFKSYYLELNNHSPSNSEEEQIRNRIGSEDVGVKLDSKTGLVIGVEMNGVALDLNQTLLHYNGSNGFGYAEISRTSGASGAYIFRPDPRCPVATVTNHTNFSIYTGDFVSEIHQEFNEWISQIVRVYHTEQFVEFEWLVGPIPTDTPYGKEVISRFSTNLETFKTFYTDSNGREMVKRIRDLRSTWDLSTNESIASNYYPVTSKILIRDPDKNIEMAVLTDRGQGGSSMHDGELELMIHRNAVMDDGCGVNEVLIEWAYGKGVVARGSHYLVVGPTTDTQSEQNVKVLERQISERKLLDSWVFFSSPNGLNFEEYREQHLMEFHGLTGSLPENVHILTLEPWRKSSFLLRLEHMYAEGEDTLLSEPAIVDIKDLFSTFKVTSLRETTLAGNQWIDNRKNTKFRTISELLDLSQDVYYASDGFKVILKAMQIRTFVVEIQLDRKI